MRNLSDFCLFLNSSCLTMAKYGRKTLQIKQIGVIYNNLRAAMVLEWTVTVQCTVTDVAGLECMIHCRYRSTDNRGHPTDTKFIWYNCLLNAILRWSSTIQHDTLHYLCQYLPHIAILPHHNTLPFLHAFQPNQVPDAVRHLQTATSYNYDDGGGGGCVLFYMPRIMERTQKPL